MEKEKKMLNVSIMMILTFVLITLIVVQMAEMLMVVHTHARSIFSRRNLNSFYFINVVKNICNILKSKMQNIIFVFCSFWRFMNRSNIKNLVSNY